MSLSLFETATRLCLRFNSPKGLLTVEDLWELPLTSARGHVNLDDIARGLSRELKDAAVESFVAKPVNKAADILTAKLDIVKRVIEVRQAENDAALERRAKEEKLSKVRELIAKKRDGQLESMELSDLEALEASLV